MLEGNLSQDQEKILQLQKARENLRLALQASADWREEAREDYRFVQGKQWSDTDVKTLQKQKKPIITINRCRAMVNLVSGYASLNAYEADFLPRGDGDYDICRAAKGITKYVYDKCKFKREKKKVFKDKLICGEGNYWVHYYFDYDRMDGLVKIERLSPFSSFADPESVKDDLSDAQYCGRFSWESPDKLIQVYPEKEAEINLLTHKYDDEEVKADTVKGEPLWYSKQLKKLRVVEYWYKVYRHRTFYDYGGQYIGEDELQKYPELKMQVEIGYLKGFRLPVCDIWFMVFVDNVVLENKKSPYKHKRFPLVKEYAYHLNEKDDNDSTLEPAGIIRDIKDVQREINKQRSQRMHIVNTQSNGIWLIYGNPNPAFLKDLEKFGTAPGAKLTVPPGVTKLERITPDGVSTANVEMERVSADDLFNITGINPEMLGVDIPSGASGRAIELKQKQAVTQIVDLFDEQAFAEMQILDLLWGDKNRPGLIPQYFTEETVVRILGDKGDHEFVNLAPNLPQPKVEMPMVDQFGRPIIDETGQLAKKVLYDLSKFEFDIVINESPATPTARLSNLYQLQDAIKSGVPAEAVLDILIDLMDFPGKQEAKQRVAMYIQSRLAQIQGQTMLQQQQPQATPGIPNSRIVQPPSPNQIM